MSADLETMRFAHLRLLYLLEQSCPRFKHTKEFSQHAVLAAPLLFNDYRVDDLFDELKPLVQKLRGFA